MRPNSGRPPRFHATRATRRSTRRPPLTQHYWCPCVGQVCALETFQISPQKLHEMDYFFKIQTALLLRDKKFLCCCVCGDNIKFFCSRKKNTAKYTQLERGCQIWGVFFLLLLLRILSAGKLLNGSNCIKQWCHIEHKMQTGLN